MQKSMISSEFPVFVTGNFYKDLVSPDFGICWQCDNALHVALAVRDDGLFEKIQTVRI